MGAGASADLASSLCANETYGRDIKRILALKELHPGNRMAKHFDLEYFNSLSDEDKAGLLQCCRSGIENPDSGMGCYAMQPADYDKFKPFFSKVLADYHGVDVSAKHVNNWSLEGVEGLPEDGILDLAKLGLPDLSMRVRVGRNLSEFPLPGAMTKDDRINMEVKLCEAFDKLIAMEEFGGGYNSLTPDHKNFIDEAQYKELVDAHIIFMIWLLILTWQLLVLLPTGLMVVVATSVVTRVSSSGLEKKTIYVSCVCKRVQF